MQKATRAGKIGTLGKAALAALALSALPRAAIAAWGFTATLYVRDCPSSASTPVLPTITGFPNQSMCTSVRDQVLAITQGFTWSVGNPPVTHNCQVGYNCTACTGTDDVILSGGAAVFSPLQNGVNSVNPVGTESGQPFYSPHYSQAPVTWQNESSVKIQAYPSLNTTQEPISSIQYQNRFSDAVSTFCGKRGCSRGGALVGSSIRTMGPTYSQPDQGERTTADPSVTGDAPPLIQDQQWNGQPISGAGVTQGAPDKQPEPNPQSGHRNGTCPTSGWWYNSASKNCYHAQASCEADWSGGPHRCWQSP